MFVPHLYLAFCIFLCVACTGYCYAANSYKLKLISLQKCKLPQHVMFKDVPLTYSMSARKVDRNTAVIKSDISITGKEGPVFFTIRGYQMKQSSSKDLIFQVDKVTCTSPLSVTFMKVVNLKLDKSCYSIPGNYSADNINIENFSGIITKTMIGPGKYSYDLEFSTVKGVVACIEIAIDVSVKTN